MKNLKVIYVLKMAEIALDDARIFIPKRLKLISFVAELQKKTQNAFLYVVNEKELGVFQNLSEVKRGMWRRLKLPDLYGHYYIDPDSLSEFIVFSEELVNKLGTFPYEGPLNKNLPSVKPGPLVNKAQALRTMVTSALQQSQSTNPINMGAQNTITQQPTVPVTQQNPFQTLTGGTSGLQILSPSLQAPITSLSFSQNQSYPSQNIYNPSQNFGQGYSQPQLPQSNNTKMNYKSVENMNRILNFRAQSAPQQTLEMQPNSTWNNSYQNLILPQYNNIPLSNQNPNTHTPIYNTNNPNKLSQQQPLGGQQTSDQQQFINQQQKSQVSQPVSVSNPNQKTVFDPQKGFVLSKKDPNSIERTEYSETTGLPKLKYFPQFPRKKSTTPQNPPSASTSVSQQQQMQPKPQPLPMHLQAQQLQAQQLQAQQSSQFQMQLHNPMMANVAPQSVESKFSA